MRGEEHRRHDTTGKYCSQPLAERLQRHTSVDTETGCWNWTGSTYRDGYGQINIGKPSAAHRVSYEAAKGKIPPGKMLCHTCDNRRCINPDHLFVGDHKINAADAISKDRYLMAERHPSAKLTNEQVREIRISPERGSDLARRLKVSPATISQIKSGQTWRSLP